MTETLTYDIIVGRNDLAKELQEAQATAFNLGKTAASTGSSMNITLKSVNGEIIRGTKEAELFGRAISRSMKQGKIAAQTFDFTFLNLLFSGMALTRTFSGMFRSMGTLFSKLDSSSLDSVKRVNELGASFEFLKFQIFDSIASSDVFAKFTASVSDAFSRIGDIFRSTPGLAELTFEVAGISLIAGTGLTAAALLAQIGKIFGSLFIAGGANGIGAEIAGGILTVALAASIALIIKDISDLSDAISAGDKTATANEIMDLIGDIGIPVGLFTLKFDPLLGSFILAAGLTFRFREPILDFAGGAAKVTADQLGVTAAAETINQELNDAALFKTVDALEEIGESTFSSKVIQKVRDVGVEFTNWASSALDQTDNIIVPKMNETEGAVVGIGTEIENVKQSWSEWEPEEKILTVVVEEQRATSEISSVFG